MDMMEIIMDNARRHTITYMAKAARHTFRLFTLSGGIATIAAMPLFSYGDEAAQDEDEVFVLGELVVYGMAPAPLETLEGNVSASQIFKLETQNVARALNTLPGVTMTRFGPRNEEAVYVRGFDRRQVPIYVDGVPVCVPYDGFADLARFTTMDVSTITLYKGYSSVLSGPNAMGGVINIVSRAPRSPLEISSGVGLFSGNGKVGSFNVGSMSGKWYTQIGASYAEKDYFDLPGDFVPAGAEDGDRRDNSYEKDWKVSGKVGYKPNETDEYAIGFAHQEGEKGTPTYAGTNPTAKVRYWQWPEWDKTTVYYTSMTKFGESYLHPRIYYDRYDNKLESYDDATYTTMNKRSSFTSIYDDYSYGASLEAGTQEFENLTLKAALHYKTDHHDEHDLGEEHYVYEDTIWSSGIEATTTFLKNWEVQAGVAYDWMSTKEAADGNTGLPFPSSDYDSCNPALALFYTLGDNGALHLSVARKSRFPTIKDRYSYKMGTAIPNPDLEPESVIHYEIGYAGNPMKKLWTSLAVFTCRIEDSIESVADVAFDNDGKSISQNQNVGKAESNGVELAVVYSFTDTFSIGGNYSYLNRKNVSSPELKPTNTPHNSGVIYADYCPVHWLQLLPYVEVSDERYTSTSGDTVDSFVVMNFKAVFDLSHGWSLDCGVKNLGDSLYAYQEGYPEAGRSYFTNLRFRY